MGSNDIQIREMSIEDYDDVIALWRDAGLRYRPTGRDTRERITEELGMPTSIFLLADLDGKIVGTIFATHDGRKGWINRLAIKPEMRRRGVASLLIAEAENRLRGMGIGMVCALIEDWNEASRSLFEREGYSVHENVLYYTKKEHNDF